MQKRNIGEMLFFAHYTLNVACHSYELSMEALCNLSCTSKVETEFQRKMQASCDLAVLKRMRRKSTGAGKGKAKKKKRYCGLVLFFFPSGAS